MLAASEKRAGVLFFESRKGGGQVKVMADRA